METIVHSWLVLVTILAGACCMIAAGYIIGKYHGRSGGQTRDALRQEIGRLSALYHQEQGVNVVISRRWLENLRTLRFSQKANERHKRANKRLRGYLDAADAWPKKPLRRDASGKFMRRDGTVKVGVVPQKVDVAQRFKTGKGFSGFSGGGEEGAGIDREALKKRVAMAGK